MVHSVYCFFILNPPEMYQVAKLYGNAEKPKITGFLLPQE